MADVALVVYGSCAALIAAFIGFVWFTSRRSEAESSEESNQLDASTTVRPVDNDENVMRIGNRVIRNRHARAVPAGRRREVPVAQRQQTNSDVSDAEAPEVAGNRVSSSGSEDNEDADSDADPNVPELPRETSMPEGKVGKMKRLKLGLLH
jgi:hypothetical protein